VNEIMSYSTTIRPTLARSVEVCVGMAMEKRKVCFGLC
jgi:hypothetical protein